MRREAATHQQAFVERRSVSRQDSDCPALVVLPTGKRTASIRNLSEKGARLNIVNPPQPGVTVLLQWKGHEAFCEVAWAVDNACGVTFERLLPLDIVTDTCGTVADAAPPARHDNIPPGRKRTLRPC
jgi:hypothetical protein